MGLFLTSQEFSELAQPLPSRLVKGLEVDAPMMIGEFKTRDG
jgi:hypothetical protein